MKFNFSLAGRSKSFYLRFCASVLGLVAGLVFFIIDCVMINGVVAFADRGWLTFVCMMVGGVLGLLSCFTNLEFLQPLAPIGFGCGVGSQLYLACFPYADIGTGVYFFCNNASLAATLSFLFSLFLGLFALAAIAGTVGCFMKDNA